MDSEFSSNRHATPTEQCAVPTRLSELCFEDGNLAVVAGTRYFVVHRGLLCRHSEVFRDILSQPKSDDACTLEGHTVLVLDDDAEDFAHFLRAMYGLAYDNSMGSFQTASAILRLSTKYEISGLREAAIAHFSLSWPSTLSMWESREKTATDLEGVHPARINFTHPLYVSCIPSLRVLTRDGRFSLIIELAKEVGATQLLASAFYDLSRYHPSQLMDGHIGPDGVHHHLKDDDLCRVLRGKEQGARFFSTFIVTELEGRGPSVLCQHRNETQPSLKRTCQMAFEAVTFELIRDVNGMVCNRNSDPLFTIAESVLMQTRDDQPGVENKAAYRACEACRLDYAAIVKVARDEFWSALPTWFELK
ncbi:hypothetical protein BD413DRAFT_81579 [Trametes elegans]|nr:hypothetical protein BD413DRAFT_81579 [Trametes elegans]